MVMISALFTLQQLLLFHLEICCPGRTRPLRMDRCLNGVGVHSSLEFTWDDRFSHTQLRV